MRILFPEDRSTPQLSFSVREFGAQAGIMITASHNPPHDNGMKFYWADGGQIVEPHAKAITRHFSQLAGDAAVLPALLKTISTKGEVRTLDTAADQAYQDAVSGLVLSPTPSPRRGTRLNLVYSSLHGTGIRAIPGLLDRFGFRYSLVAEQRAGDSRFPTVKSPTRKTRRRFRLPSPRPNASRRTWSWPPIPIATAWAWPSATLPEKWCC